MVAVTGVMDNKPSSTLICLIATSQHYHNDPHSSSSTSSSLYPHPISHPQDVVTQLQELKDKQALSDDDFQMVKQELLMRLIEGQPDMNDLIDRK